MGVFVEFDHCLLNSAGTVARLARERARRVCVRVCGVDPPGGAWGVVSGCMKFLHVLSAAIIDRIHKTNWSEIKTGKLTKHRVMLGRFIY